jgi:hypothetical protein
MGKTPRETNQRTNWIHPKHSAVGNVYLSLDEFRNGFADLIDRFATLKQCVLPLLMGKPKRPLF